MTNLEFFKEELAKMTKTIAIVEGKPTDGCHVACTNCDRDNDCTDAGLIKWLLTEHIEETDNSKLCKNLKVDDKILVSNAPLSDSSSYWNKRHFAEYDAEHDMVITYDSGTTSWTADKKFVSHWKYAMLPDEVGEQNDE